MKFTIEDPAPFDGMNYLTIYKHRVSRIRHWASCGENPTLAHFRHFSSLLTIEVEDPAPASPAPGRIGRNEYQESSYLRAYKALHLSRILDKSHLFLQNKPNYRKAKMNANSFYTVDYENIANCKLCENKANTNPIKPNTKPIKANKMPKQTQSNPISKPASAH